MLLFLVGFMGCGKSTAGMRLAERIGYDFADLDEMITLRAGMSISEIFARKGEEEFRKIESGILGEFTGEANTVIATGGGAPCFGDNMALMNAKGKTVYFRMTPENLFARLQHGRWRRPKIAAFSDAQLMDYIRLTLAERERYYLQSSVIIDCNGVDDTYLADHLRVAVENFR